jgi:hypothetical protein
MSAKLDGKKLTISTTEYFKDYEKEQENLEFEITLQFGCENESSKNLDFIQKIKKVNNFDPEFTQDEYKLEIGIPLPKNFDVGSFGPDLKIIARDADLEDYQITFSIEGTELIYARTVSVPNSRNYEARLITKDVIRTIAGNSLQFDLIATDSGDPKRNSSVPITIFRNEEEEIIESLSFEEVLYQGILFGNNTLEIGDIALNETAYDENVKFRLDGGFIKLSSRNIIINIYMVTFLFRLHQSLQS